MERKYLQVILITGLIMFIIPSVYGQKGRVLQYDRIPGKDGLNVFETKKQDTIEFEKLHVRLGGDFAMQFQLLSQTNSLDSLVELGNDFNLPTANLNIDVQLYDGIKLHLRLYLSSKQHEEAWVKGGHLQMDKLDFIKEGFLGSFMEIATIRIGLDEFNYGDAHFRRSDNARTIYNPFVSNYIMDSFSTEAFGELTLQKNGLLGVIGITNGKLNQSVKRTPTTDNKISFYGKIGYDKQLDEDLRLRLTGSWYINKGTSTGNMIYGGDRAGSRYYHILETLDGDASSFEGRFNPRFTQLTALQFNPFVKYKGLEFFGIYEVALNGSDVGNGSFTQFAAEALYRFGNTEQFYVGGRYNSVSGESVEDGPTSEVNRVNIGGGWFMTKNVMMKVEYVSQKYKNDGWTGTKYDGAEFDGLNLEAVIGF
jgi:hypothetical protein